ncbi:MAG: hypothetical protein E6R05_04705 [Candidatus Moraniibacteriota bacterium]|nr:MAG: hypothetical protein E6R05_04705 [Candidatus Moranbacteria bacterium]
MLTISDLLVAHTVLEVLSTLERVGVFGYLKKRLVGATAVEIEDELNLNASMTEALLDFLVINVPEAINKQGDKFLLKPDFNKRELQNTLYFHLAYRPVLNCLPELLRSEKEYGVDVFRVGEYLRVSSKLHNQDAWRRLGNFLMAQPFDTLVDLGCSAGDFLIEVASLLPQQELRGVEIDLSMMALAEQGIAQAGLGERCRILQGDIAQPRAWKDQLGFYAGKKLAFVGITVWHELLFRGEDYSTSVLRAYKTCFPGSLFCVIEYNGFTLSELPALPSHLRQYVAVYQLMHSLTKQGQPQSPRTWEGILKKGGVTVTQVIQFPSNLTLYVGRL